MLLYNYYYSSFLRYFLIISLHNSQALMTTIWLELTEVVTKIHFKILSPIQESYQPDRRRISSYLSSHYPRKLFSSWLFIYIFEKYEMVAQAWFHVLRVFNHDKYSIRSQVDIITGLKDSVKQACVARAALARSVIC